MALFFDFDGILSFVHNLQRLKQNSTHCIFSHKKIKLLEVKKEQVLLIKNKYS